MTALDDLKAAMDRLEKSRITVVCSPENLEAIRNTVKEAPAPGLIDVQSSVNLPDSTKVYVFRVGDL